MNPVNLTLSYLFENGPMNISSSFEQYQAVGKLLEDAVRNGRIYDDNNDNSYLHSLRTKVVYLDSYNQPSLRILFSYFDNTSRYMYLRPTRIGADPSGRVWAFSDYTLDDVNISIRGVSGILTDEMTVDE